MIYVHCPCNIIQLYLLMSKQISKTLHIKIGARVGDYIMEHCHLVVKFGITKDQDTDSPVDGAERLLHRFFIFFDLFIPKCCSKLFKRATTRSLFILLSNMQMFTSHLRRTTSGVI